MSSKESRVMSSSAESVASAQTSTDRILDEIRSLIVRGTIRPGERINVRGLSDRLGVSHIPIREALRHLEGEGLVKLQAQRGAIAARVSSQELDDVYDLRRLLEPAIAVRAGERADEQQRQAVLEAHNRLEVAEDAADSTFFQAHWDFHWALLSPGSTAEVQRVLQQLWRTSERYIRLTRGTATNEAHEQHDLMVRAMLLGDGQELGQLVSQHLTLTGTALQSLFEERRDELIGLGN